MNNFFSNINRLKLLVFIRFLGESLFFPFISLYLSSKGFKTHTIGIFISAIPITALICAPIYQAICKTPKQAKISLMIMAVLEPLFIILLMLSRNTSLSLISIICLAIFSSTNYGLFDSLIALTATDANHEYSKIRIFGSTSYMLGVLLSSIILKHFSYNTLFIIAISIFIFALILYFTVHVPNYQEAKNKSKFKDIFTSKSFVLYAIFYVLLIGSMQTGDDFFSLYIQSKGAKDYYYSYVMVGFIIVEMLTMFTFKFWFKKLGYKAYFISAAALVLRLCLQMIPSANLALLISSQMIRGLTWGIALSLNAKFIVSVLGNDKSTRGIVFVTFMVSLFTAIFKFTGGYIIESIGYSHFYMILFCIASVSFIYFIFYYKYQKRLNK